jgi:hypothetical protein
MVWIGKLFTDSAGSPSSKRVATFVIVFLLYNKVMQGNYTDNDMTLIEQLLYAVFAMIGILTIEGFGQLISDKSKKGGDK